MAIAFQEDLRVINRGNKLIEIRCIRIQEIFFFLIIYLTKYDLKLCVWKKQA